MGLGKEHAEWGRTEEELEGRERGVNLIRKYCEILKQQPKETMIRKGLDGNTQILPSAASTVEHS